jgi:hypothetical protein
MDHNWALSTIQNAYKLAASDALKGQIYNKQLEMEGIHRKRKRSFGLWNLRFSKSRVAIIGIIVGLRIILALASSSNSSTHYRSTYNSPDLITMPAPASAGGAAGDSNLAKLKEQIEHMRLEKMKDGSQRAVYDSAAPKATTH